MTTSLDGPDIIPAILSDENSPTSESNDGPLHPTLLALELTDFRELTTDATIRNGISWYRSRRVVSLGEIADGVRARFDGGARGEPEGAIEVFSTDDGLQFAVLDHDGWEEGDLWGYVVATVIAYQAMWPVDPALVTTAADRAREERARRGREEVLVEPASGDATGTRWRARSVGVTRPGRDRYEVTIRSPFHRLNGCTCPDYQLGGLGTCKHIEAVLHRIRTRTKRVRATTPDRAALCRVFEDGGADWWALLVPEGVRGDLAEEGLIPSGTVEVSFERLPAAHSVSTPVPLPKTTVLRLPALAPFATLAYVHACVADARVATGADVAIAFDALADQASRQARRDEVLAELEDWDGSVPGVRVTPFPYQRDGIRFLVANGRALLADDMGLGKTLQSIAGTAMLLERGEIERALIVCPTSLIHQWRREIERFTDLDVKVVEGGRGQRAAALRSDATITITTYDRLRLDFDIIAREHRPDLLILDEAQRIKNWATRNAQHVAALNTRFAFVLSGTPLENRVEELYSLMQIVDPTIFGPLWRFHREFCVPDLNDSVVGYRGLGELRRRIAPVLLRRERAQVLTELPPRTDIDIDVALDEGQRAVHSAAVDGARQLSTIRKRRPLSPAEKQRLLSLLQRARMACDSGALVDDELAWRSPKLETLAELLQELCIDQRRKVVVFSEWVKMGEFGARIAAELGIGAERLHGGVPSQQRGALIERFESDPKTQVFFSSDAGGVGLNLQAATALIHMDCPWNPAVMEQRTARVHRHGQTDNVQIFRLLGVDSYEQRVASLVSAKKILFNAVVGEDSSLDSFSLDDRKLDQLLASLRHEDDTDVSDARAPTPGSQAAPAPITVELTEHEPKLLLSDDDQASAPEFGSHALLEDLESVVEPSVAPESGLLSDDFASADDERLSVALAALSAGSAGRQERASLLADLLRDLPDDADIRLAGDQVIVAVDEPDSHASLATAYAPLRVFITSHHELGTLLRFTTSATDDSVVRVSAPAAKAWIESAAEQTEPTAEPVVPAEDPRVTSARLLWDAGQKALAVQLMVGAELDRVAATLGVRAPRADDAWRWLYVDALPNGAVDPAQAGALAVALGALTRPDPDAALLEAAWAAMGSA